MAKEYDNIGVHIAIDNLSQCLLIVKNLCGALEQRNFMISREDFPNVENSAQSEKEILIQLEKKFQEYLGIIKDYGKSVFTITPQNREDFSENSGSEKNEFLLMKNGFDLLNEASGLKLGLIMDNFQNEIARLQVFQKDNLQLYQDRLDIYNISLKSIASGKKSITYDPKDETNAKDKTARSVILNRVV